MVEQNTSISITQADITGVLSEKNNLISNLELQLSALKRTVIELQSEATLCQCKEEQDIRSEIQSDIT